MFYIQHGYGKGEKIQRVAKDAPVAGVILSPANEDDLHLRETAAACRSVGLRVLMDPQTYIYSLTPQGSASHHVSHGLELTDLHWSQTAKSVKRHTDAVLDANSSVGTTGPLIAPSPFQANLNNYWLPIALQYGRAACDEWGNEGTYASIIIDEAILQSWESIEEWLDILTTLDVQGFYLIVNRPRAIYPSPPWDPHALANLLRLIYSLTEINGYELIWGYSDIDGLLGLAVGANGIASGWSYGLRGFSTSRWNEKRSGGAATVPRVFLSKLWAPLRWNEAEDIFATPAGNAQFSPELRDHFSNRSFESWSIVDAQEQHLKTLAKRARWVMSPGRVADRVGKISDSLAKAQDAYASIAADGVALDPRYLNQVRAYREALALFRNSESL